MLSRSNFSIRRLMPQRRQNSDDNLFWDNDEKASMKVTDGRGSPCPSLKTEDRKRRNSRPWMSKGSTKKIPQPIIVVRSSEDLHRITHLPPLPDTPHSSKSFLCSCEQHAAGYASPRRLPRGASPGPSPGRGSMQRKTHSERRVSPPPGSPLENPRPSPKLPTDARTKNKSVKSLPSPTKLTFDLLEALEIQPDNEEMTTPMPILPPTPPRRRRTTIPESDLQSENVNQLIRQPDKTSDSVDAEISTEDKPELDGRVSHEETIAASPPTRPAPPPPVQRKPVPLRHTVSKRVSKPALSPLKSASVSKTKRQKSQKSRNGRPPRPVAKKQRSKWSVNAKDLLIVRLFNRLEVDEVLSPTRLQEIRMSGQILSRRSSETLRTIQSDGSDTPVDPFNLQDLPTRIGAAGVRLSIPSPIIEVPTPRSFEFNLVAERRKSSVKTEDTITTAEQSCSPPSEIKPSQPLSEEETMPPRDASFPALPVRNPSRLSPSSRKDLPHLPSIPEVMVTTPENFTLIASTFSTQPPQPILPTSRLVEEDPPYINLPSTPYTLTVPAFRHGPIRLAKADIALSSHSSKLATATVDDSLDWTAFHMAILGGAGDSVFGESTDYSRRADGMEEDELDEICEWFAGFGFSGYGRLDSGVARQSVSSYSPPVTVDHSPTSSARSSRSGKHLPIPVEQEFPTGFWNQQQSGQDPGSRFDRARSVGLRRWTVEGHPKRYEGNGTGMMRIDSVRRPSVDSLASLPQSPMLDLRTSRDVVGNEYTVPMGYNLSHDARDFLSWGAENVCAEAFAGGEGEEQGKAELEG
ncbi:hypothetical protein GE09DRAFT_1089930 [Coniochaeta sp. 2T2.1]|nr:hypothetical protein GE09DRAFT_1089930 [Coniochaeta sp. 2T2.1]